MAPAETTHVNDTAAPGGVADHAVEWRPPKDGVLRGPPLSVPVADESLGLGLLRRMQDHGPQTALVDAVTGEATTYRDLVRESVSLARALRLLLKDVKSVENNAGSRTRRSPPTGLGQPAAWSKELRTRVAAEDIMVDRVVVKPAQDETDVVQERTGVAGSGVDGGRQDDVVVGVFLENRRELVQTLVANLLIGVPVTMLNPLSNTGELVRAWSTTRPSVALCSWGTLAAVLEASHSLPSLRHVVVFPGDEPEDVKEDVVADENIEVDVVPYATLLRRVPDELVDADGNLDLVRVVRDVLQPVRSPEHTAYLLQCGRGGASRVARLTHRNLAYTVQLLQEPASGYGWTSEDVLLLGGPLTHAFGLGVCLGALALGAKMVVMPFFREQLFLAAVQAHKVTQLVLIPPQAALLAHSPLLDDVPAAVVETLRGVVCAAAPLPRALHRDLTRRLLLPEEVRQAYGLTQASCSLLVAPRGAPPDTQGRVVPGAEAKIVDVTSGEAVAPLQVGELLLRAPSVMAEYLQDPDATREVLDAEGWLRTGDLAYYDRNGYVFVVDRLKDVLVYTRGHFKEFTEPSVATEDD